MTDASGGSSRARAGRAQADESEDADGKGGGSRQSREALEAGPSSGSRVSFAHQASESQMPGSALKIALLVCLTVSAGVAAYQISSRIRNSHRQYEALKGGLDDIAPRKAVRDKNREAASAKQRHKDPLQDALLRTQEEIQQAQAHQMQLAEDIRLARVQPPPPPSPPPPPMMSRAEWEKLVKQEAREKAIAARTQEREKQANMYWLKGDWYWKSSRNFRTPLNDPKVPQCFRNATARSQDYWAPIPAKFVQGKPHLPIYDVPYYMTSHKARCFAGGNKPSEKKGFQVFTCPGSQWDPLMKQRWVGGQCLMKPLHEEMLLFLLRGHRLWFFGDYNMKTVHNTLQCVMASYVRNRGKLPAGRLTGVAPEYETLGADDETELLYVYVGPYKKPPGAEGPGRAVMGLGEDLRSRHGLDAMIHLDPHATAADLARHHELADAIQENMHNFKPTDVIVFNIGNDYAEPRSLQASLLKFLRLYEDNAEHMPVLIWQESTAQHHQGLQGGDRLGQHKIDHPVDPTGLLEETIKCGNVPAQEMEEGNWRNQLSNRLIEAAGIPILRIWKTSTEFHNQYTSRCPNEYCTQPTPCRYYCFPGAMPTFVSEVLASLLDSDPLQEVLNARANKTMAWWEWEPPQLP